MALSVIMATCLNLVDGSTACTVTGAVNFQATNNKQMCTDYANASINEKLLESGKSGWAYGQCVERSTSTAVINAAVEYLESQGFKVKFNSYKG